jgi:hypothetical protein
VHNTKELRCRRSLDNFDQIITLPAGMADRFATALDCAGIGFLPDGILDHLTVPAQAGPRRDRRDRPEQAGDLREIVEGQARRPKSADAPPQPREQAHRRSPTRSANRPSQTWRARKPPGPSTADRGAATMKPRRPKPWAETNRQDRTRYVWRFEDHRYWTTFYDDPEEARADATTQITEQLKGAWQERSGRRMLLEDWIDVWVSMLGDIEPTTRAKYKYFVEGHILPEFQGRQPGSLTFEEIEAWDNAIPKRISARARPYGIPRGAGSLFLALASLSPKAELPRRRFPDAMTKHPAAAGRGGDFRALRAAARRSC